MECLYRNRRTDEVVRLQFAKCFRAQKRNDKTKYTGALQNSSGLRLPLIGNLCPSILQLAGTKSRWQTKNLRLIKAIIHSFYRAYSSLRPSRESGKTHDLRNRGELT